MNVFIIGTPLETAKVLDKKRLNKQIIECGQMLKAISGESKAWANHPATKMYSGHWLWLRDYMKCLDAYRNGDMITAEVFDMCCRQITPAFHCQEYFDQMKRRLYTKDNEYYKQWESLGESDVNWYVVDGAWKFYRNGKVINDVEFN